MEKNIPTGLGCIAPEPVIVHGHGRVCGHGCWRCDMVILAVLPWWLACGELLMAAVVEVGRAVVVVSGGGGGEHGDRK